MATEVLLPIGPTHPAHRTGESPNSGIPPAKPTAAASARGGRTAAITALRVVASVGAAIGMGIALPASANADVLDGGLLNDLGIGNNGVISQAIAQIGTAICPLLVQPGSQIASTATTASGQGALGSQLAGGVAGLVVQSQCPSFMTALANGDFTVLANAASMLGMTTPGANPLSSITGAATSNPIGALTSLGR